MTHLPECDGTIPAGANYISFCICDRLRAAEQRIDAGWRKYVEDNGGTGIEQYDTGFAAGLTACRDAVAALSIRTITLLVAQAGGEITVTHQTMIDTPDTVVLQRIVKADGSGVTYKVLDKPSDLP